jgi:hypothetical protein
VDEKEEEGFEVGERPSISSGREAFNLKWKRRKKEREGDLKRWPEVLRSV